MKNGERHSLARIPLRWMIRECFATKSGIIFDAHMLKNEIGLDIDPKIGTPKPIHKPALEPGFLHLRKPSDAELGKHSLRHIPATVVSGLVSPFRWAQGQLSKFRIHDSKKFIRALRELERRKPITEGEPHEELNDALSPIFDQIELHPWWNIIEWLPCKLSPLIHQHRWQPAHTPPKGSSKSRKLNRLTASGRTSFCKSPHLVTITDDGQCH